MTASDLMNKAPAFSRIPTWIPLLAFILLIFLICAAGYTIFAQYKKSIIETEVQNLGGIADLKVAQIVAWRENHRRRAEMFLHGSLLSSEVDLWLREGAPADERKQNILIVLAGLRQAQNYKSILLLDKEGATRLSTNGGYKPDKEEIKLVFEAMRSQRVLFSDLHREGRGENRIKIDSVAPLRVTDEKKATRIVGALLFEIEPDSFLYPMIQSWPTQSASAETLLTRRDGDDVLFLNEVRHKKGAALSLRIPLTNTRLPSAQAVLHQLKSTEGVDYRGVPVVAAIRSIPDTPWFMVSKIDKAELFAPINTLQRWVTGLGLAFAVLGGALVFLWFKGQRAHYAHLKTQHDAAVEHEILVKHLDYLTKYANDIVLLLDAQGRIVETNDRAVLAYGYTKEQLKSMSMGKLLAPGIDLGSRLEEIEKKGGLKFESVHIRKNGSALPVESSVRAITIEGERYFQAIIRDITERKRAESALRKNEALLKKSQQMAHIGSWELDLRSDILFWSDENFRIFEVNPALFDSSYEAFLDATHPDDRVMVDKAYTDSVKNKTPYNIVHRILFPDKRVKFVQEWCETQYDHEGRPIRSVGTTQDITESKRAEEALRQQKNFILQVIDTDPNLIFVKDARGKFLLVNQAMATLHGKTVQKMVGMDNAELFRNREEYEPHLQADREVIASGRPVTFVARTFLGGKERWVHVTKVPMKQGDGSVNVLGIAVDITERKLAEERLNESYQELEKLTTHLEVVREDEQKRIARELHDEMGGVLAALSMKVSLMAAHPPTEMTDLMTEVDNLAKLVTSGIQAMRRTVTELRPTLLDEVGLKFAIERYVHEFERNTEIECDLRLPEEELTLDGNQSTAIFRIIQESLTNVAKHAKASKVSIVLSEWDTVLMLTVTDNGKGFDLNTQKAKSFGLLGIRERAAMVGGKAQITSAAGKGTTVRVSMPLLASRREGAPDN
jgi:PAS domain S-box-containing protein